MAVFEKFMHSLVKKDLAALGIRVEKDGPSIESGLAEEVKSSDRQDEKLNFQGFGITGSAVQIVKIPLRVKSKKYQDNYRHEWLLLEYDSCYNPETCFHMEIHWLAATGLHIEEWVLTLKRKAKFSDFNLVQVPTNQVCCHSLCCFVICHPHSNGVHA